MSSLEQFFSFIAGLSVFMGALGYLIAKVKMGGDDALRKSNEDLRLLVADQTKILEEVRKELVTTKERVNTLEQHVDELLEKNGDLSSLIQRALEQFFLQNPDIAISLHQKISKSP